MCKHETTQKCSEWILCLQCKEKLPLPLSILVEETSKVKAIGPDGKE